MKCRRLKVLVLAAAIVLQMMTMPVLAASSENGQTDEKWVDIIETIIDSVRAWHGYVSVALYFPDSGESVYYNADYWFSHASLYKLPLCMKVENMALHGDPTAVVIEEKLGVEKAVEACLVNSNNAYGMAMLDHVGRDNFYDYVSSILTYDEPIAYEHRVGQQFTARLMLDVLKELYSNSDEYPHVIDYMKQAQPNLYLKRFTLPVNVEIAQKYGGWDDLAHIAGIIYAEHPVLVVIMTRELNYAAANNMIGQFALTLCEIAAELL